MYRIALVACLILYSQPFLINYNELAKDNNGVRLDGVEQRLTSSRLIQEAYQHIIQTPIGQIAKVPIAHPLSKGWRSLQIWEGKQIKLYLNQLLGDSGIAAFKTGKLEENKFSQTCGPECRELLIIRQ